MWLVGIFYGISYDKVSLQQYDFNRFPSFFKWISRKTRCSSDLRLWIKSEPDFLKQWDEASGGLQPMGSNIKIWCKFRCRPRDAQLICYTLWFQMWLRTPRNKNGGLGLTRKVIYSLWICDCHVWLREGKGNYTENLPTSTDKTKCFSGINPSKSTTCVLMPTPDASNIFSSI